MLAIRDDSENFIRFLNTGSILDLIDIMDSNKKGNAPWDKEFELELNDGRITAVIFYGR